MRMQSLSTAIGDTAIRNWGYCPYCWTQTGRKELDGRVVCEHCEQEVQVEKQTERNIGEQAVRHADG